MFSISFTNQFKKDYSKASTKTIDIQKLHKAFEVLENTGTLPVEKYKTHLLKGNFTGHYEAHIKPDWLLIWLKYETEIRLVRLGSHSELFK